MMDTVRQSSPPQDTMNWFCKCLLYWCRSNSSNFVQGVYFESAQLAASTPEQSCYLELPAESKTQAEWGDRKHKRKIFGMRSGWVSGGGGGGQHETGCGERGLIALAGAESGSCDDEVE